MKPQMPFQLSISVQQLADLLGESEVTAARILQELFRMHPEYGGHLAGKIELTETGKKQTFSQWLEEIQDLYNWDILAQRANNGEDQPM